MQYATALLALAAAAAYAAPNPRRSETFNIELWNNCDADKTFGLYQITPSFQMVEKSTPTVVKSKGHLTIAAPYNEAGMRLSATADQGAAFQWSPQALFEFGYSGWSGVEGTAYDLSVMQGADANVGVGVYPIDCGCEAKTCFPWDCPADQGWTNPAQVNQGSPADTVCYEGKKDFKVVFCP